MKLDSSLFSYSLNMLFQVGSLQLFARACGGSSGCVNCSNNVCTVHTVTPFYTIHRILCTDKMIELLVHAQEKLEFVPCTNMPVLELSYVSQYVYLDVCLSTFVLQRPLTQSHCQHQRHNLSRIYWHDLHASNLQQNKTMTNGHN